MEHLLMNSEVILEKGRHAFGSSRLDRIAVGPLRFGSKINEKVDEKRDIFQEVLFERLFPNK